MNGHRPTLARRLLRRMGYDIVQYRNGADYPQDFSAETIRIAESVSPYTMTTPERLKALVDAVRYVVGKGIEGAFVECGVWKGGSAMAMAMVLQALGVTDRELYLYDTYAGMSAPGKEDVSVNGLRAEDRFRESRLSDDSSDWCLSPLEEVRENLHRTGYPAERIHFVEGKVEETIPGTVPERIALLRIDTDWYESTRHEMIHLYPLLERGGVLIVDDYGHWEGARKAVDEYIAEHDLCLLLNRIDKSGRMALKL